MIIAAALDPASLAMWTDASLFNRGPMGALNVTLLRFALINKFEPIAATLSGDIFKEETCFRIVENTSAIWHEKRHFLDLVLSNYGAFRFRTFWQIYLNLGFIATHAVNHKEIYFPLTIYTDKLKCRILKIPPDSISEGLLHIGNSIKKYENMLSEDSLQYSTSSRSQIQIGGDAQLEAIAFLCQFYSIKNKLGSTFARDFLKNSFDDKGKRNLYLWWCEFFDSIGHKQPAFKWIDDEDQTISLIDNSKCLIPILYAALSIRKWGQNKNSDNIYSAHPGFASTRLAHILDVLKTAKTDLDGCTTLEAWDLVNEICKVAWGKSAVEEIENDISVEFQQINQIDHEEHGYLRAALEEYNNLRKRFLALLIEDPEKILCGDHYADTMLEKLYPITVSANAFGLIDSRQKDVTAIFHYDDSNIFPNWKRKLTLLRRKYYPRGDDTRWSWAVTMNNDIWNSVVQPEHFTLKNVPAWTEIIRSYAPFAKLSMKGRNHRIGLGPELLSLEAQFSVEGVEVKFDPLYEFPIELIRDAKVIFDLSSEQRYNCDGCRSLIPADGAEIFSPWIPRKYPVLRAVINGSRGGGIRAQRSFLRDWSPWVLCPSCSNIWHKTIEKFGRANISEKGLKKLARNNFFIKKKVIPITWTDKIDQKSLRGIIESKKY